MMWNELINSNNNNKGKHQIKTNDSHHVTIISIKNLNDLKRGIIKSLIKEFHFFLNLSNEISFFAFFLVFIEALT